MSLEVIKTQDFYARATNQSLYGFYANMFLSTEATKANASRVVRVVKEFEVDRMEPDTKSGLQPSL